MTPGMSEQPAGRQPTIPARRGNAAFATQGQTIKVTNTHGEQVVDARVFTRADLTEFMSMEHSRAGMLRLIPKIGDRLLTNRRRAILSVLEDTSGGIHDRLMAACDVRGPRSPPRRISSSVEGQGAMGRGGYVLGGDARTTS